jgi:tetratricopeptide (TPR) repeat protein
MRFQKIIIPLFIISLIGIPQISLAQTYQQLIQQGKAASASEDFVKAEAIWRKVLQQNPNNADVRVFLGRALRLQERLDEALAEYRKAIALNSQNPYAWNGLGNTLADQGDLNEAITAYRTAIKIDKKFGFAYSNLGHIYSARKEYNEAISYYEQAIKIDPKDPIPRISLEELKRDLALQRNPQQPIQIVTTLPEKPLPAPLTSVVKIVSKNSLELNYGTGWVLTKQGNSVWIVTNRHVIGTKGSRQSSKEILVEFYSSNEVRPRLPAKIVNITKETGDSLDLAVLEVRDVPERDINFLQLSSKEVSVDTQVRVIGHPNSSYASDWTVETGRISNTRDKKRLQLSGITIYPGNSGSPVLDGQNNVVGIVTTMNLEDNKGKEGTAGFGYAYRIELVKNQLRTWGYGL